ncbi:nucleoporin 155 [Actinidia rufa]|uniref:Nucleoporin 155 n=1 Tax=Actinidia rufa TaxID=165716 RepID=A0A7J0DSN0_9ERIC|nr:nucleoporin 155 [Actinidia rufa]
MSSENEIVLRDVTNACLVMTDRIGRDVAAQLDLEEALEASRYSSHPYSTHPREVPYSLFILTKGYVTRCKGRYTPLHAVTAGVVVAVGRVAIQGSGVPCHRGRAPEAGGKRGRGSGSRRDRDPPGDVEARGRVPSHLDSEHSAA